MRADATMLLKSADTAARAERAATRAALATRAAELRLLPENARRRAFARLVAVRAWRAFRASLGLGAGGSAELFAAAWRGGAITLSREVAADLPTFCGRSLGNWERLVARFGAAALAGAYRPRRHTIDVHPRFARAAERLARRHPLISGAALHRAMLARFGAGLPSARACQRWIVAWRTANAVARRWPGEERGRGRAAPRGGGR